MPGSARTVSHHTKGLRKKLYCGLGGAQMPYSRLLASQLGDCKSGPRIQTDLSMNPTAKCHLDSFKWQFLWDHCNTCLTHNSPSLRKTHCSGGKHTENVRDHCQKRMDEQAQRPTDQTTAAFHQGKVSPTPFSAPPSAGAMMPALPSLLGPPHAATMPAPHRGSPPTMPVRSPSSWDAAGGPAPAMRAPTGGHVPVMPGPPLMPPPARPMMVLTRPGMIRPDKDRGVTSFYQFYITCPTSPDSGAL
ncbi:U1 small nuclear ribonucleoprotein C-like [Fukomys damarensis]|uniref:U1 small nuclear ribonucleoprotein C-like n=1 Tax=Fukomys damarensis TaxID=885580 RepID=UPI00053F5F01|nr:U1 small nuclear ribonucleoprotein C-like [Fukomys damarensis]